MCFPSCSVFLQLARRVHFAEWSTDFKWWGHSSKAQTLQRIHPQQYQQWRSACMAGSAGAAPRPGHRKCQACVATWKGQPACCSFCWPVDLSHCYLYSRTREVSINHLFISLWKGHPDKLNWSKNIL